MIDANLLPVILSLLSYFIPIIVFGFLGLLLLRQRIRRMEKIKYRRDLFYISANEILADPDTPPAVGCFLRFMTKNIDRPTVGRLLISGAAKGKLRQLIEIPDMETVEVEAMFGTIPDHILQRLNETIVQFFLAQSYMNDMLGVLIRRVLLYAISVDSNLGKRMMSGLSRADDETFTELRSAR